MPFPAPTLNTTLTAEPLSIQLITDAISGPVNTLLLNAICASFLIPTAIALFLFNSHMWRTPVFIMNVFAIALGIAFGIITIYYQRIAITLQPVDPGLILVVTCLYFFIPICTQSILLIRVVAVYPPRTLTWKLCGLIYGVLSSVMVARLANAFVDFAKTEQAVHRSPNALLASEIAWKLPYAKVEFILQLFYDVYASALFLLRLREGGALRSRPNVLSLSRSIFTNGAINSYSARLRGLFWIAVFNFVFPVIFNIVVTIFAFRDPNVLHIADVIVVNLYVEIISVLFATVWCSGTYWESTASISSRNRLHSPENGTVESLSSATFAPSSDMDGESEREVLRQFRPRG